MKRYENGMYLVQGRTLCENAQVEIYGATVEELEIIKQFLESGVYIE